MEDKHELVRNMREDYYTVYVYTEESMQEEDYEDRFLCYGNPDDLASMMDAIAFNDYEDEDGSTVYASISYETGDYEHTILYMDNCCGPDYEVVADNEVLYALAG